MIISSFGTPILVRRKAWYHLVKPPKCKGLMRLFWRNNSLERHQDKESKTNSWRPAKKRELKSWKVPSLSWFWINFGSEKLNEDWNVNDYFGWRFQECGREVELKCGDVSQASIGGLVSFLLYFEMIESFLQAILCQRPVIWHWY